MTSRRHIRRWPKAALLSTIALTALGSGSTGHAAADADGMVDKLPTETPIKHVIIIVGENRSFDHLFATYEPVRKHERVLNLLSEGIINSDGTPGPNFAKAQQFKIVAPPNGPDPRLPRGAPLSREPEVRSGRVLQRRQREPGLQS